MTRKEATKLLYKIYRILEDEEVKVSLNRRIRAHGDVTFMPGNPAIRVRVNPSRRGRGGILGTLLHELLHIVFFDFPEYEISRLEKEMFRALSDRQLANLLKRVAPVLR